MLWCLVTLCILYYLVTYALSRLRVGNYVTKHVLITGCDRGFGNLLAKRLDGLGFHVFAACLTSEGVEKLQRACSTRVTSFLLDVTSEDSVLQARQFIEDRPPPGQGLWGVVNNAGVSGVPCPSEWLTPQDWTRCLEVNLLGVIRVSTRFLPLLRRGQGRVVNMSSIMGRVCAVSGAYCVSKYGVEAFSDCLRREVYRQGVSVCLIEPGYFKTDIINAANLNSFFRERYDSTNPDVRQHYGTFTPASFAKLVQYTREKSSDDLHLVVDACELALTSRFPPTRQIVGNDARFFFRLLTCLPDRLADWLLVSIAEKKR